jgi:hypothetical protein
MADVNMPEAKANYSATEKELALAAMASKKNDTLQVWHSCHAAHSFYGRQRRPRQFWPSVYHARCAITRTRGIMASCDMTSWVVGTVALSLPFTRRAPKLSPRS